MALFYEDDDRYERHLQHLENERYEQYIQNEQENYMQLVRPLFGPKAKVICDSISPEGHRLTTMEVVMHRYVLAEFNTHRVFSRNSASSRAIPTSKIVERIKSDMAYPVSWGTNQKGMQAGGELMLTDQIKALMAWQRAGDSMIEAAEYLADLGVHKQITNRLLEPFMWHTVIVTSTEWANFFNQRCHPDAQPEMKAAADEMQRAYYTSKPRLLKDGHWHLPYVSDDEQGIAIQDLDTPRQQIPRSMPSIELLQKVSVARCARVSYLTHDGVRDMDMDKDLELYDKLFESGHWSPFEHVATPLLQALDRRMTGNFQGWQQYRKYFIQENRTDFLPNLSDIQAYEWMQKHMRTDEGGTPE